MPRVKGTVEAVYQNKGGFYNIKVGEGWYGAGRQRPDVAKGDVVEFNVKKNGNFMNIEGNINKISSKPVVFDGGSPRKDRDASIVLQSSYKTAVDVMRIMFEQEAVKLPTKKQDRYDAILALLDDIATTIASKALNPDASAWEKNNDKQDAAQAEPEDDD